MIFSFSESGFSGCIWEGIYGWVINEDSFEHFRACVVGILGIADTAFYIKTELPGTLRCF